MKLMKDPESSREDYLLQDNKKTKRSMTFIAAVLIFLVIGVITTGFILGVF